MKHLVLVGDGMADYPLPDQGGATPLELASTPAMDRMARQGICGLFCPIPDGLPPGSDIGNLSLFGYNPRETFTGRAPLEAASQGIALGANDVAFRCNLVTLRDGIMEDFTSGHITTDEARPLIESLHAELSQRFPVELHPGVSYRHLLIFRNPDPAWNAFRDIACTPPHDITGRVAEPYWPKGNGADIVSALMRQSQPLLAAHPGTAARVAAGHPPCTSIWLWGQGEAPSITPYPERFGLSGAVISAVDLVKGIGICAGLERIDVPGATGYLDTNYAGKVSAALEALDRVDFVYVHVEAPDETSHQGRFDLKVRAIEDFDANVVAPCLAYAASHPDVRVMVAPDHVTALSTQTHAPGPVPFAVCGAGVEPGPARVYHERAAADTGLLIPEGCTLLPFLFGNPVIQFDTLKRVLQTCQNS